MPSRIIRDGILTSERVCSLSWPEEVFYRRLHSVVDDYGRYFARPDVLRAACYPLQLGKVSDSDVVKWLEGLVAAALVRVYQVAGKEYLEVLDFRQELRKKIAKYPAPPEEKRNEEKRREEEGNGVEATRSRGSRLPTAWQPSEHLRTWASNKRPDLDIDLTVEKFQNYWASAPGGKGVKLNWEATFRNWVLNESPGTKAKEIDMDRLIRELEEEEKKRAAH